ncbi:hypothetical protein MTO96_004205 [Rhipicephalus appendiculatus]
MCWCAKSGIKGHTPHRKLLRSDMHHSHARQNARPQLLRQSTRTHTEESPFSKSDKENKILDERLSGCILL